jgi:ribosome-interacting GTPase 1
MFAQILTIAGVISVEDKIRELEAEIRNTPHNKSSEGHIMYLKRRISLLRDEVTAQKRKKKAGKRESVKKTGDAMVAILGPRYTGKTTLLGKLAPKISTHASFNLGTLIYKGANIQLLDVSNLTSDNLSLIRESDLILFLADAFNSDIEGVKRELDDVGVDTSKDRILKVINKVDMAEKTEGSSAFYISAEKGINLESLKDLIYERLHLMRIYLKPVRARSSGEPMILRHGARLSDVCRGIHTDMLRRFKYAQVWGKSVKYGGQRVGLEHKLMDGDVVTILSSRY